MPDTPPNDTAAHDAAPDDAVRAFREHVLRPVAARYPGREELVELLGLCLVAADNLLVVGPPGTAKSEVVAEVGRRLGGRYFEYLLTRFTEPSELFGPVDIVQLREGRYVTRREGMLPEAEIVFLDEVFHAGSAILNALLDVLNTGVWRRGPEVVRTDIVSVLGATNALVDDPELRALEDRFTLRCLVRPLEDERLNDLLRAGWTLERERLDEAGSPPEAPPPTTTALLRGLHRQVGACDLAPARAPLAELVTAARASGLFVSDRRAVKLQRLAAASAVLCGRTRADCGDLWPARYIWEAEEDREGLEELVEDFLAERVPPGEARTEHPLASRGRRPEDLLDDLGRLESEVASLASRPHTEAADRLHDRLSGLDRERRWCRARGPDDEDRLRELDARLGSVAEALAEKAGPQ